MYGRPQGSNGSPVRLVISAGSLNASIIEKLSPQPNAYVLVLQSTDKLHPAYLKKLLWPTSNRHGSCVTSGRVAHPFAFLSVDERARLNHTIPVRQRRVTSLAFSG